MASDKIIKDVENPPINSVVEDMNISEADLKVIRRVNWGLRVLNMCVAVFLAYTAAESLSSSDPSTVFIAAYVFFFSALMCCFEVALKGVASTIARNFGFLYSVTGRTIFLCFVAGMCYKLSTNGIVSMSLIAFAWVVYIFIRFRYPKYEEYVRKTHVANAYKK